MENSRVVPEQSLHKIYRGDLMDKKYDATYKYGNTTVHVVAPKHMAEDKKNKIIKEMHLAGWAIIDKLVREGKPV